MKYAISESEDGGVLSIASSLAGERLLLEVADTGPGYEPDEDDERRGIGMRNVIDRLHTLYGDDYEFLLSRNSPTGLKVSIQIPLQILPMDESADSLEVRAVAQA